MAQALNLGMRNQFDNNLLEQINNLVCLTVRLAQKIELT